MAKGLLLTVGASAESEIYCIRQIAPNWVSFLCTPGSRDTIDLIAQQTGLQPSMPETLGVHSLVPLCWKRIRLTGGSKANAANKRTSRSVRLPDANG